MNRPDGGRHVKSPNTAPNQATDSLFCKMIRLLTFGVQLLTTCAAIVVARYYDDVNKFVLHIWFLCEYQPRFEFELVIDGTPKRTAGCIRQTRGRNLNFLNLFIRTPGSAGATVQCRAKHRPNLNYEFA